MERQRQYFLGVVAVAVLGIPTLALAASPPKITNTTIDGKPAIVLPPTPKSPIPPGTVIAYAGGLIPDGWAPCDGSYVKIDAASKSLAAALSTAFGGDGVKTFRLPDMRGRTAVGLTTMGAAGHSDTIPDPWAGSLGKDGYGGEANHTITMQELPPHHHEGSTITGGEHHHIVGGKAQINRGKPAAEFSNAPEDPSVPWHTTGHDSQDANDGAHTHSLTITAEGGVAGAAKPITNVQPSIALNYLIKY
jgi:microcystin-dependent protein